MNSALLERKSAMISTISAADGGDQQDLLDARVDLHAEGDGDVADDHGDQAEHDEPVLEAAQSAKPVQPMYCPKSCRAGTPSHVAMNQFQ